MNSSFASWANEKEDQNTSDQVKFDTAFRHEADDESSHHHHQNLHHHHHDFPSVEEVTAAAVASARQQQQQQQQQQHIANDQSVGTPGNNSIHDEQVRAAHEALTGAKKSNEQGGGGARGRKKAVPPLSVTKRAVQNRNAQRAYRTRRDQYIKELEAKAAELDHLKQTIDELRNENIQLRDYTIALQSRVIELSPTTPAPTNAQHQMNAGISNDTSHPGIPPPPAVFNKTQYPTDK
ncbi:kapC [[Candida] subhashii]|uniref:KapC n=1 Tax=[Candida] subhashii TaxID=561895 RepID=A0A8J5QLC1_9ASCO|nr:kapC [[Candida] subhashii]KAG7662696.1 kapC [[Candida] subhashii]